ncbi:uncharacterized protein si:dkey-30c15.2 [Oreochromis niloticus]|uniref:Si:dkey-30c15.2 n=1 Tax=Oreochromis niloticus TaxID=8128 RepID=I3KCA6_ORENI|nr:uncharacterized protein LOC102083174 [Oreochromis niloticus]CAI5664431.1 unnamed protein product [Mustela putorius furo]
MELNTFLSGAQIDVLSTVYIVLLTPSVIGSFSVLVVSIARWQHLKEQVHILVQLALADLLAALILMSMSLMNKIPTVNSIVICQYGLPLSLTFYFISFLLVVAYAWKSKNVIQGWRERPADDEGDLNTCRREEIVIPVYAIVWMIPLALYLAYVLTPFMKATSLIPATSGVPNGVISNDSTYCTSCILFLHVWRNSCSDVETIHDVFIRAFLFIVVIPVMVSCSIIYYKVGKWYERRDPEGLFPVEGDGRSRRRMKRAISTARNMVTVILICWAPALFLILLSTLLMRTNVEQRSLFGFYMIQAASVSLQGFLNSMVYAWRRPNFTEAILGESTPLMAYNHMPFFDESLRTSF